MNVIYRYIKGSNIGILGKLKQHTDTFSPDIQDVPPAEEAISSLILEKLDSGVVPKHRGSMGIIYVGCYMGNKVAIKVIPDSVKRIVDDETWVLNLTSVCNLVNKSMNDIISDLELRIKSELRMDLEYNNLSLIRQVLLTSFGCRTLRPIHSLCDSEHFVYEYEPYKSITKHIPVLEESKKIDIYTRILSVFLECQLDNVYIGDLNSGNFLYDDVSDEIIIIDYGCVFKTSEKFRLCMNILLYNFLYARDTRYLSKTFCNSSKKCESLLNQIKYLISGVEVDFSDLELDLMIFDVKAIIGSRFRPETITILRSISYLLLLAKKMRIKLDIRNILVRYAPFGGDMAKYQPKDVDSLL